MFSPKTQHRIGWLLTALPALMLTASAAMKFIQPAGFAEGFSHLGWPISLATTLALLEIACTALYLFPRTSVLGAILLTGYLGGAIATHGRVSDPYYIPVILGVMVWGGLYFRNPRVRALIPLID